MSVVEVVEHWRLGARPWRKCPSCSGSASSCLYYHPEHGSIVQHECPCGWIWSAGPITITVGEEIVPVSVEPTPTRPTIATHLFEGEPIKPAGLPFDYATYNRLRH